MTYAFAFNTSTICTFNTFVFLLIIDRFSFMSKGFMILSGCYDMTPSEKYMYVTYVYDILFERSFPEISETQLELSIGEKARKL